MSRAMTPPYSPTGGPEGERSRLKEAPLGVSSRSYSERRKLNLKSAKNFPQKLEGEINYDISPDHFPYIKQRHSYLLLLPSFLKPAADSSQQL